MNEINYYPGHMAKAKRQIIEDLRLIDVVIEVLDARIPSACLNPDINEEIKNKNKIIVLNKVDLADDTKTVSWVEYFKKQGITAIPVTSNSVNGAKKVTEAIKNEYEKIKEKYVNKGRIGKAIRVMIVGIPNVGKSTLINSLAKRNTAKVGNKPGVTKQKQWIKIDENIELMDTPGMLWPKLENAEFAMHLAFIGTIDINAVDNEEIAYNLIKYLAQNYPEKIENRFGVKVEEKEITDILEEIAQKRGAIMSGGNTDYEKVSNIILNDFRSGKLGRITIEIPG